MNKRFKKLLVMVLAMVLLVSLISGCQNENSSNSDSNNNKSNKNSDTDKNEAKDDSDSKETKNNEEANTKDEELKESTVNVVLPMGAEEEEFFVEQHKIFMEQNPNIKVTTMATPPGNEEYTNAVQLMFADGKGPDIFRISGSYTTKMNVSHAKGWLASLQPYVDDEFKSKFPETFFGKNSGLFVGDELYAIPLMDLKFNGFRPFMYNKTILKEFGYDEPPKTWSELDEMATKITKEGKGSVYGFGLVEDAFKATVTSFADAVDYKYSDVHLTEGIILYDMTTGKSATNNEGMNMAMDFFKDLYDRGVIQPGWETSSCLDIAQQFAASKIAMMNLNGFVAGEIMKANPDIDLGIAMTPVPDAGRGGYRYIYYAAEPYFGMSSTCEDPDAAFKLLEFYSSKEFQEGFYKTTGRPTFLWNEYSDGVLESYTKDIMANANKSLVLAPYPSFMHKDGEALLGNVLSNTPKPNLKDLYLMGMIGEKSYSELAKEYDEKIDKLIDDEIAALRANGSDITRDVLLMPDDWDYMKDYIME